MTPSPKRAAAGSRPSRRASAPSCDLLQRDPERRPTLDALLARPFVRRHLGALAAAVRRGGMRRQASFERALAALRLPPVRPGRGAG